MTYSSGGTIQASDYNNFATQVNNIWGTGYGNVGYGQSTTLSAVSSQGTITATQWATMINTLNSVSKHQSGGSGTGISAPTAGNQINYLSTL